MTPLKNIANTRLTEENIDLLCLTTLTIAGCFLFIFGIGSYGFWDPWEPKYGQAMREMVESGDLIVPHFMGAVRWTKPIFHYWAMYVPMKLFGVNEFTARLPSALAALLGVIMVYFFVKRLRSRKTALMASGILATTPHYFLMARQAMPDMLLTLFLTASLGFFSLARFGEKHKSGRYYHLFYAALGLATLTKGPVAGAIVVGTVLLFLSIDIDTSLLTRPKKLLSKCFSLMKEYRLGVGIIIFLAIAGPWYAAILYKLGHFYIDDFLMYENIQRFAEPVRGHHGIVIFYVQTIMQGMYPWYGFLPLSLLILFDRPKVDEEVRQKWFFFSWFLAVFLIFTAAGTKLYYYILPITPPLAVIVAMVWEKYFNKEAPFWIKTAFILAIVFTLLPIRDFLLEGNGYIFNNFTHRHDISYTDTDTFYKIFIGAWALVMTLAILRKRSRAAAIMAVLIAYGNGLYLCHYVMPRHTRHRNVKPYIDYYIEHKKPSSRLAFLGRLRHSMNYYYQYDKYTYFNPRRQSSFIRYLKDNKEVYLIIEDKYMESVQEKVREQTNMRWYRISDYHPDYSLVFLELNRRRQRGRR
jgi:4-amino-4-deoxy-L-arabinose transferase-like glycosyltransferase